MTTSMEDGEESWNKRSGDFQKGQMIIAGLLCLTFVTTCCRANSQAHFKMLRGQGDNYTVEEIPREEDLEYPRNNRRILSLIRDMWEKYYKCLLEKEHQENRPEIRRLLEGQYTELRCDICPRPFQNYDDLQWMYRPLDTGTEKQELQYLDLTPEMTYTENKTIRIFNAVHTLEGLYVCFHKRDTVSVYILEVSKNDSIERVKTSVETEERYIQSDDTEFQVSYRWTEWTECNACGRVGKKYRYGTCYVLPKQDIDYEITIYNPKKEQRSASAEEQQDDVDQIEMHFYTANSSAEQQDNQGQIEMHFYTANNSTKQLSQKGNNTWEEEFSETCNDGDWDLKVLGRFSTGIPCASPYLPKSMFEIAKRLTSVKVLVKPCWEPCQETEIFEVFDCTNRLIEQANNTGGIYSVFQKIPQLPRDIERRIVSADFGTDITIQCPGTSFTNTPVVWKINKQIIFPDVIAKESKGRFTIDLVNRINLKKLRLRDSRIYSCWQKEKLIGTVNLYVEKKFKIVFDHHVTLIVIIVTAGLLLLLGSKMIGRELRMRRK